MTGMIPDLRIGIIPSSSAAKQIPSPCGSLLAYGATCGAVNKPCRYTVPAGSFQYQINSLLRNKISVPSGEISPPVALFM